MPELSFTSSKSSSGHGGKRRAAATAQEVAKPVGASDAPPAGQVPAELLKAFEHNYRSRHRSSWRKYAVVFLMACLAGAGWRLISCRFGRSDSIPQERSARQAAAPPQQSPRIAPP